MSILITGADGQLGRELQRSYLGASQLVALSHRDLDVTNPGQLKRTIARFGPTTIINAAAYTDVDGAESGPKRAFAVNANAPRLLAQLCVEHGLRLVHISTDYVFGGKSSVPYRTDDRVSPINVYGESKRAGEIAVLEEAPDCAIVLRTSWLYSAFGHNFLLKMMQRMMQQETIEVVDDQIGTPTWALSVAQAIWKILEVAPIVGLHHWTDAGQASWYDFAMEIAENMRTNGLISAPAEIRQVPTDSYASAACRPRFTVLDCSSTQEAIGMTPTHWRTNLATLFGEL